MQGWQEAIRWSIGVGGRGSGMRKGVALALGLTALVLFALIRPGPVIRWLARRYPDVLFHRETEEPLVALTIDDSPTRRGPRESSTPWPSTTPMPPSSSSATVSPATRKSSAASSTRNTSWGTT